MADNIVGANASNMADTDGRRNENDLTAAQFKEAKEYAVSLGMVEERIEYDKSLNTAYMGGVVDGLIIGTDVLPLNERSKNPNDNISLRGAVAHEIIGHRAAALKGYVQSEYALEEAQASIRASKFAKGLTFGERMDLARDGIMRLKNAGLSLKDVKNRLFIYEE